MYSRFALVGSTGRVGTLVVRACSSYWADVPLQTRMVGATNSQQCLAWDIRDGSAPLRNWMSEYDMIDTLIVLAGVTTAKAGDVYDNVSIAEAYLEVAREVGIRRILLASSSAVYGAGDGQPLAETSACLPLNDYGHAKLQMEQVAGAYATYGFEVCCMRIGNIAGADAMLLNAPRATSRAPLMIDQFADGRGPLRSYLGPAQFGEILTSLATHPDPLPACLNVGGKMPVYMEDIAEAAGLPWIYTAAPKDVKQVITLDCTRLADLIRLPHGTGDATVIAKNWIRNKA